MPPRARDLSNQEHASSAVRVAAESRVVDDAESRVVDDTVMAFRPQTIFWFWAEFLIYGSNFRACSGKPDSA